MSFCAGCIDLKELPGSPTGTEKQIAGLTVYVAEGSKKGSILIAPDIYGLGIVNPRIVADKLAKQSGFTVFAVDYFKGGQMKPEEFELPSKASEGAPDEAKMGKNFENFMAWFGKGNGPDKTFPLTKPVIEEAKKSGPVGVVGYCYGGKIASLAAQESGLVDGIALYHPSLLEPEEADKITTPVLINGAELDPLFAPELRQTWETKLKAKNLLDAASTTYPNTVHGFGLRPDLQDTQVKSGWEKSIDATSSFFNKVFA
ncbi:alpha/beta-hydrolase [Ceraceosorus guamensis]|uniref:Alpha/beta-hydrolase n=1 Tax=Ceraceosorus guamensis TaxID=1522189 RepID=A0A316VYR6_9BASI|nr:alpha/beta-hydrolase [Ceraceosorus guamensis]PWN41401.1 alpha/beta-hydrolase [Ceraceosorus guamensis]